MKLLDGLHSDMVERSKRLNDLAFKKRASNWLLTIPMEEEGYMLDKQLFRDLISTRYGLQLKRLSCKCECGSSFDFQHVLCCRKEVFISLRHNGLRSIVAKLLDEVCRDVAVEPRLTPPSGEQFKRKSTNTRVESLIKTLSCSFFYV